MSHGKSLTHSFQPFKHLDRISRGQSSTAHAVLLPTAYFTVGTQARFHNIRSVRYSLLHGIP